MGDCVFAHMHKVRTRVALSGNLITFWAANMAVSGVRRFTMGRQLSNPLLSHNRRGFYFFYFTYISDDKDVNAPGMMLTDRMNSGMLHRDTLTS